jgi:hypothetical protein
VVSKIPEAYRPLILDKTSFATQVILYGHYQLDILGLALTAITLTGWLVAKHFANKISDSPAVASTTPATPATVPASAAPTPPAKETTKK